MIDAIKGDWRPIAGYAAPLPLRDSFVAHNVHEIFVEPNGLKSANKSFTLRQYFFWRGLKRFANRIVEHSIRREGRGSDTSIHTACALEIGGNPCAET